MTKPNLTLLLSHDPKLERECDAALRAIGGRQIIVQNAGEALRLICRHKSDVDLVVLDCENGSRGLTILAALSMLDNGLPVLVITSTDAAHTAAVAYANGASACLAKPANETELEIVIRALSEPKLQLRAA